MITDGLYNSLLAPPYYVVAFMCNSTLCPIGGAHEGLQHLGPYGNIPNIVAELTGDSVPKDFSEDHGYPDPPNPCPLGKTGMLVQMNAQKHIGTTIHFD